MFHSFGNMRDSVFVLLSLTIASLQCYYCSLHSQQPIHRKFVAASETRMVRARIYTADSTLLCRLWASDFRMGFTIYLRGGCDSPRKQEEQTRASVVKDAFKWLSADLGVDALANLDVDTIMRYAKISLGDAGAVKQCAQAQATMEKERLRLALEKETEDRKFMFMLEKERLRLALEKETEDRKFMLEKERLRLAREKDTEDRKFMLEKQKLDIEAMKVQKAPRSDEVPATIGSILDSPLPALKFGSLPTTTTTEASFQSIPTEVCRWEDFAGLVQSHRANLPSELLQRTVDPMKKSSKVGHVHTCNDEADVVTFMDDTICQTLNQIFGTFLTTTRPSKISGFGEAKRLPDFVSGLVKEAKFLNMTVPGRNGEQSSISLKHDWKEVAIWEVKRHFYVPGDDLVAAYRRVPKGKSSMVQKMVHQAVGYQILYRCKFAILTNYICTWAIKLLNGVAYISPGFNYQEGGPRSTLNMIFFVLCSAAEEAISSPTWNNPILRVDTQFEAAYNSSRIEQQGGWGNPSQFCTRIIPRGGSDGGHDADVVNLALIRVLVNNGDRITWQARAEAFGWMLVAVKCFEDPVVRDSEAYFYDKLAPMQGVSIPRLLVKECTLPGLRRQGRHAFITAWVGPLFGGNYLTLPWKALVQARLVVEEMHRLGVVHGDARPENMFYNFTSNELYIYDFSHASSADFLGKEEFEVACAEELESLDEQIAWSQTEQAEKIRYMRWDE